MYDSPCMTWTIYWTLIQPALLFDYPECLPPALILSPNSDFDSALSTLCLKLVIEFCLFELHSVLIKLHMDPNATDSSLQCVCAVRAYLLCMYKYTHTCMHIFNKNVMFIY